MSFSGTIFQGFRVNFITLPLVAIIGLSHVRGLFMGIRWKGPYESPPVSLLFFNKILASLVLFWDKRRTPKNAGFRNWSNRQLEGKLMLIFNKGKDSLSGAKQIHKKVAVCEYSFKIVFAELWRELILPKQTFFTGTDTFGTKRRIAAFMLCNLRACMAVFHFYWFSESTIEYFLSIADPISISPSWRRVHFRQSKVPNDAQVPPIWDL